MKRFTRSLAKERGLQKFFTGKPCVHGHTAQRYVSSKSCVVCSSLRNTSEKFKQYRRTIKLEVFDAYGGAVCKCCGESELRFLSLDHTNNDGAAHRRKIVADANHGAGPRTKYRAPAGFSVYFWLKTNDFPSGFQVLCYNCNIGRHQNGGICPHRLKNAKTFKK